MSEIDVLNNQVTDGKILLELMKNEDFKRLFIDKQEAKILEVGYSMSHLKDERKVKAVEELGHISYFFDRMYEIINDGNMAVGSLRDIAEEEAYQDGE